MLKSIVIVTIMTANLALTEEAYDDYLGYETVEQGTVDALLAHSWGAEKVAGQAYTIMQPQSKANVFLRFIESPEASDYYPMRQEGWNATELLVEDPDKLAIVLKGSPFKVIGTPEFLTKQKNVRAMQALGPNNELLYFTRIIDPDKSKFDLGQAKSFVGRVFISVLGSKEVRGVKQFYQQTLKQDVVGPYPYRVGVLSDAYSLPKNTVYQLSLSPLSGQFLIEIDQYPEAAEEITHAPGMLPDGVAMVSFQVASLEALSPQFIAPAITADSAVYGGRRSATLRGSVGELMELIEWRVDEPIGIPAEISDR